MCNTQCVININLLNQIGYSVNVWTKTLKYHEREDTDLEVGSTWIMCFNLEAF